MTKKILVVAAHPDDEILGCGGTMSRHSAGGDEVRVIILAQGLTSRADSQVSQTQIEQLHSIAKKANSVLGVQNVSFMNFPDNKMDSIPLLDVIHAIEKECKSFSPDVVYTHHLGDLNIDHRRTNEAVLAAFRPQPHCKTTEISFFEVPSSTEWLSNAASHFFSANSFVNITQFLEKKIEALRVYESEMREWPHARSYRAVEALARWRGASVGVEAAEAFMVGRRISF